MGSLRYDVSLRLQYLDLLNIVVSSALYLDAVKQRRMSYSGRNRGTFTLCLTKSQ